MTKYAVISTDSASEYYSLIPIVAYSWHKLGYTPVVIVVNCSDAINGLMEKYCPKGTLIYYINTVSKVKDSTISQFSRLFACYLGMEEDDIIVTGDGDMIVMKDIFLNLGEIESYGFDLTGRTEIPICYVSGSVYSWKKLINYSPKEVIISFPNQDAISTFSGALCSSLPENAYSNIWENYWGVDQQFLTQRAREYCFGRITFIDRGFSGPVAANRWDRYNWDVVPDDIIDVHCIRGLHRWPEITEMAEYLFPGEVGWMGEFYEEIKQLQ